MRHVEGIRLKPRKGSEVCSRSVSKVVCNVYIQWNTSTDCWYKVPDVGLSEAPKSPTIYGTDSPKFHGHQKFNVFVLLSIWCRFVSCLSSSSTLCLLMALWLLEAISPLAQVLRIFWLTMISLLFLGSAFWLAQSYTKAGWLWENQGETMECLFSVGFSESCPQRRGRCRRHCLGQSIRLLEELNCSCGLFLSSCYQ